MTIQLPPDIEMTLERLHREQGLDPHHYVIHTLRERLRFASAPNVSPAEESHLIAVIRSIGRGLTPAQEKRYTTLKRKRDATKMTSLEQEELISLSDSVEDANVRRLVYLHELARRKSVTLDEAIAFVDHQVAKNG